MSSTPTFRNPPVVEFVLGVQFAPLVNLTAGHFGRLWNLLGDDWERTEDAPLIPDQFEQFERPQWTQRGVSYSRVGARPPLGRLILHHRKRDRLVQVQPTRFHLNWRKTGDSKPSYKKLIDEFAATFTAFQTFVESQRLGELAPNQWEITYIDAYPQGEYWQSPDDWSSFLPGLFGGSFQVPGITLEQRAAEWSYTIQPKLGRLHIAAQPGRWGDEPRDSLLVDITARGPIDGTKVATWRSGLDLGHTVAVESFLKMTDPGLQAKWERIHECDS